MKKIIVFVLAMALVLGNGFMMFEGVVANAATVTTTATGTANSVSLTYPVEVTVGAELTLTCDTSTLTLLPNISGMSGGTASSSRACNVKTNNFSGYIMTIRASTTPALQNTVSSTIAFTDAGQGPASWADATGTTTKFAFTASGTDSESTFSAGTLWRGFVGTTTIQVAHRDVATAAAGIDTTIGYRASAGPTANQPAGLYRSWSTVTAYMQ